MIKKTFILIVALFTATVLCAQIEVKTGEPLFPDICSFYDIGIDASQTEAWKAIDQPKDQPYRFAIPAALSLTPLNSGVTYSVNGETIWVVALSSKGALSLNVMLEPFNLPHDAYVYVYDADRQVVRGAFTSESAAGAVRLPVLPVPGEKMIVECHFKGKSIPAGAIGISQASHDFAGFFGLMNTKDENYGTSELCEVDLKCSAEPYHMLSSRSVCRLLISGQFLCTGTLVNNTGADLKAYLLTAFHCVSTADEAASTIVVFNYISPWCDGPDVRITHSISGASLIAKNGKIDFALLQLSSFPPMVFEPYFAGWNISATAPSNNFVIHHPSGDIMKVSVDNDPPTIASYPDYTFNYLANGFWKIGRWDSGTTEGGSSGSALFDQDNRIRGTLTGGEADCALPVNDFFARIDKMFSLSAVSTESLRSWLDPISSGVTAIDGRDPYLSNFAESDTLYNIPSSSSLKTDILSTPGYGYSTGINSDSLVTYAEYFNFTGTGEVASLAINVAKASFLSANDTVRVYLYGDGPAPGKVLASKKIRIQEVKDNFLLKVDFDKAVPVTGPFYAGYRVYYKSLITSPQTQFAAYHSDTYADNALNTAWFNNGSGWYPFTQHPSYPAPVSLAVKAIIVPDSKPDSIDVSPTPGPGLTICPNPFSDRVSFISGDTVTRAKLSIYDNAGTMVYSATYDNPFPGELPVDLPGLAAGIYHFMFWNGSIVYSGTIIRGK